MLKWGKLLVVSPFFRTFAPRNNKTYWQLKIKGDLNYEEEQ